MDPLSSLPIDVAILVILEDFGDSCPIEWLVAYKAGVEGCSN